LASGKISIAKSLAWLKIFYLSASMKFKRHIFRGLLLLLIGGLAIVLHKNIPHSAVSYRILHREYGQLVPIHGRVEELVDGLRRQAVPDGLQRGSSDNTGHKEKRHGKTLISQDFVAAHTPLVQASFTYFHRNYSLFLPGGSQRPTIGNFSLRGPPAFC
jgi:hypothetical protein